MLGGLQRLFAQPPLSCSNLGSFLPQAIFHILAHLCPHPYHLAGHWHLWHRPHWLRPARDDRVSKFKSYQPGLSPPSSPVTHLALKWQPAGCRGEQGGYLGVPAMPWGADPPSGLSPGELQGCIAPPAPWIHLPVSHADVLPAGAGSILGCCWPPLVDRLH